MYKIGDKVTINDNSLNFNGRLIITKPGKGLTGSLISKQGDHWCIELGIWPEVQWIYYSEQDFNLAVEKDTLPNASIDPKSIHTGE